MKQDFGVFDVHSDLFTNVTLRRQAGETNVIRAHHIRQLRAGNVCAMLCCIWIDPPYTENPPARMVEIMASACAELREAQDIAAAGGNLQFSLGWRGSAGCTGGWTS